MEWLEKMRSDVMDGGGKKSGWHFKFFLIIVMILFCQPPSYGYDSVVQDGVHTWNKDEVAILRSLWIGSLPPPPKDPSNKYSEDKKAARLGKKIFFDKAFSKNRMISCGTCHMKEYDFTEAMPRAHGMGPTVRRTPPIIGMAYLDWFFWDGRADSLWSQALGPPENPNEHGITRTLCARIISERYRKEYEEVFGALPDLPKDICLPIAKPDPEDREAYKAWTSIPPSKSEEITRVYVNMGKAMAAYMRMIVPGPSRFDRYVGALLKGDKKLTSQTLNTREIEGLRLFIGKAKCVRCHSGPLFTNGEFRRTGVYQPAELSSDTGRAEGIKKALSNEFNCLGKYSDAGKDDCVKLKSLDTDTRKYVGAFKVPTLRNIAERAPYMHAGQYWALWETLRFYSRMKPSPDLDPELYFGGFTGEEMAALEAFLQTLSGPLIVP